MDKKLLALVVSLLAVLGLVAGCGSDDDDSDDVAAEDTTEEAVPAGESEEIDPAVVEEFIAAFIDDPTLLCDPDNATEQMLEDFGGEEICLESAATEEPGQDYEVVEVQVTGGEAEAVIENATGTTKISFVQEGDQLKVAAIEEVL
jgi:hypothetical protein